MATVPAHYPAKPVRIVEPFGAGGGPDLLGRALAPQLSEMWGQPVTVENVIGAGATAGPALVAILPADGHTLLINTSAQAYSAVFSKGLSYDPLHDFIPVIPLTRQAYVLVAGKATGISTIADLIETARSSPLKFGSMGIGTGTHVGIKKFNRAAGIRALHVPPSPIDSNANTIAHAVAGHFAYYLVPISLAMACIRDGALVALGVSTIRRSSLMPDVPTIAEAGVPGFDFPIWYGLWVRTGTPKDVVDKLASDIGHVLARPDLREWIENHGGEPMIMTQTDFAGFVGRESATAARLLSAD